MAVQTVTREIALFTNVKMDVGGEPVLTYDVSCQTAEYEPNVVIFSARWEGRLG